MLCTDDVGVVSQPFEQLRKMMGVIVVVCVAFDLTVSEVKTEITCLRTRVMPEATAIFNVASTGQVYNQTNEFIYLGGDVDHNADLSIKVNRCIRNAWCSFRKYTLELYHRAIFPLKLNTRMPRAEVLETMLYGCVTRSPRVCHYDTIRQGYHSFLTRCIDQRKNTRTGTSISYLDALVETGSESIDSAHETGPVRDKCGAHGGHKTAEMRDVRRIGGWHVLCGGGRGKSGWGVTRTTSELSVSMPTSRRLQPRTTGNDARRRAQGRNVSW